LVHILKYKRSRLSYDQRQKNGFKYIPVFTSASCLSDERPTSGGVATVGVAGSNPVLRTIFSFFWKIEPGVGLGGF